VCKGCGARITWAYTYPNRKAHPLDADSVALSTFHAEDDNHELIERHDRATSHFATCVKSKDFSGKSKPRREREPGEEG
jgi:hypothetical protein